MFSYSGLAWWFSSKAPPAQTFLVVQRLRLYAPNAWDPGSVPGQGTKFPQAVQPSQNKTNTATVIAILSFTEHTPI